LGTGRMGGGAFNQTQINVPLTSRELCS